MCSPSDLGPEAGSGPNLGFLPGHNSPDVLSDELFSCFLSASCSTSTRVNPTLRRLVSHAATSAAAERASNAQPSARVENTEPGNDVFVFELRKSCPPPPPGL